MPEYNLNMNEKHQMYIQHNILFIIQQTYGATDSRQPNDYSYILLNNREDILWKHQVQKLKIYVVWR